MNNGDLWTRVASHLVVAQDSSTERPKSMRVGCYAWIVKDGRILLPRLAPCEEQRGKYTLPGGGMEFGESPDQCLIREVFEETGLHVRPLEIAVNFAWVTERETDSLHCVALVYRVEILGGIETVEIDGTTDALEWFDVDMLHEVKIVDLVRTAHGLLADNHS